MASATSGTGSVNITGSNFDTVSVGEPIFVVLENVLSGEKTVVTPTSFTDDKVVFDVPMVQAGNYQVRTRKDPSG